MQQENKKVSDELNNNSSIKISNDKKISKNNSQGYIFLIKLFIGVILFIAFLGKYVWGSFQVLLFIPLVGIFWTIIYLIKKSIR